MSIPSCDVQLLRRLWSGLQKGKLHVFKPYSHRASAAVILRFAGNDGVKVSRCFADNETLSPEAVLDRLELHSDANADSSLSILFLRKRYMEESRWSGVVAFPGGARDKESDHDDFSCLKHWCDYSLGMPIGTSNFDVLGRLPD